MINLLCSTQRAPAVASSFSHSPITFCSSSCWELAPPLLSYDPHEFSRPWKGSFQTTRIEGLRWLMPVPVLPQGETAGLLWPHFLHALSSVPKSGELPSHKPLHMHAGSCLRPSDSVVGVNLSALGLHLSVTQTTGPRQVTARPCVFRGTHLRNSIGTSKFRDGRPLGQSSGSQDCGTPALCPQAVKSKKRIPIQVILATGGSLAVSVDSASTSREICQHIAQKQGLKDQLGFSLQVAVYDKVSIRSHSLHMPPIHT